MQSIIIMIIMWVVFYNIGKKKKEKENTGKNAGNTYTYQTMDRTQTTASRQLPQTQYKAQTPMAQSGRQPSTVQESRQASKTQKALQPNASKQEEKSVTEYLREKAEQDEIEHQKEKMQKKLEDKKCHGHLNVARRLELGEPIPPNQRMTLCPYCAAENLIPIRDNSKYYCYFCHHELR